MIHISLSSCQLRIHYSPGAFLYFHQNMIFNLNFHMGEQLRNWHLSRSIFCTMKLNQVSQFSSEEEQENIYVRTDFICELKCDWVYTFGSRTDIEETLQM